MRKRIFKVIAIILAIIIALLLAAWFIPTTAGEWGVQEFSEGYTGSFEKNNALDQLSYLDLGGYTHPEAVVARGDWLYITVKGGVMLKIKEDGSGLTKILDTGGCLLGFDFDRDGNIIVADCDYEGTGVLLKVSDESTGAYEVIVGKQQDNELFYPNAVAIAKDGKIYFSDSSSVFPPAAYGGSSSEAAANETFMHTCTGRVMVYDPQSGAVETLAEGFAFSNGLALSEDEKTLFVCETYEYAVHSIDVNTGEVSDFLKNLPGFPDNLTKGEDGRYWVGFNGERSNSLDAISDQRMLRKALWLYGKFSPSEGGGDIGYCHVFAFTEDGVIVESLQSGSNEYYRSTGATETGGRLYIQSINDTGKLAFL